jgi:hypothetical protein
MWMLMAFLACGAKAVPTSAIGPVPEPIAIASERSVLSAKGEQARLDLAIENKASWPVTLESVDYIVTLGSREYRVKGVRLSRTVAAGAVSILRLDAGVPQGTAPGTITGTLHWTGPIRARHQATAFEMELPLTEVQE